MIEPDNFTNKYMEAGNQREKEIFDWFCKTNPKAEYLHHPRIEIGDGMFETHGKKFSKTFNKGVWQTNKVAMYEKHGASPMLKCLVVMHKV